MLNEGRVFSNKKVLELIAELGVELVKIDMTGSEQIYTDDLARADRKNIPVNLLYPADYPKRPAILLEEVIGPTDAMEALQRIQPEIDPVQSAVVR